MFVEVGVGFWWMLVSVIELAFELDFDLMFELADDWVFWLVISLKRLGVWVTVRAIVFEVNRLPDGD